MAVISYGGKAIQPGPLVSFAKEFERSADGVVRRVFWAITVTGKTFAWKGSPDSTGAFWTAPGYPPDEGIGTDGRLRSILAKEGAIQNLFSTDGLPFLIQPWDGTAPTTFNPRIKSVEFTRGPWYEYVDWVMQCEADVIVFGTQPVSPATGGAIAEEVWAIETADEVGRTYRLTHQVSASQKRRFNADGSVAAEGWQVARDIVIGGALAGPGAASYLGLQADKMVASGVLNYNTLSAFNYFRAENIDEPAGKFGVNETWLLYDVNNTADSFGQGIAANEEFECTSRISGQDGKTTVSLQGSIKGMEVRDPASWALQTTRLANAQAKWNAVSPNLLARGQNFGGVGLNPIPISRQYGTNPTNGVITWSAEFDNRPTMTFPGALSQNITVQTDNASDVFAVIPVLGRAAGPVLQSISTVTENSKNLEIEIIMPAATMSGVSTQPNTGAYVATVRPQTSQVFVKADRESWDERSGRYSRSTSWVYQ